MPHSVYIKHSNVLNKIPTTLEYGDIAINYNSEQPMLCTKTDDGNIIDLIRYNNIYIKSETDAKIQSTIDESIIKALNTEV